MTKNHQIHAEFYKPYQSRLLKWLIFNGILVLLVANIFYYVIGSKYSLVQYQNDLKTIASTVSKGLDVNMHEKINNPDQLKSEEYKAIETYFQTIMKGNPNIDDIYTLRRTDKERLMTFVVSGMPTKDKNNNGKIEEDEIKPAIGEIYDTTEFPAMDQAIEGPSVDKKISFDKWGAWLSGYAPIINLDGSTTGIVGVDFSADIIIQSRWQLVKIQLISDAFILPFLLLFSYFMSKRMSRPLKKIGEAMHHISNGEIDYVLPYEGYQEDKMFAALFNTMKEKIIQSIKNKKP